MKGGVLGEEGHPALEGAEQEVESPVVSPESEVFVALFGLEGLVGELGGEDERENGVDEATELYHEIIINENNSRSINN